MTLLWHDHFATSDHKVGDLPAMRRQNETLRGLARAPFGELLGAMVRDPALLVYLDARTNRKGHPNENLARELMELFALGVGNYTERDVKEVARALTGWSVADGRFSEVAADHDGGEKTVLGRRGPWRAPDVVAILLDQPAAAVRVAARLCGLFFGEPGPGPAAVRSLADGLRRRNLDVGWAVGTVLRSALFFADANVGTRVPGPAEFPVGAVRALEMGAAAPDTVTLADWAARLGQDLFHPPSVFGWPGGRAWVSTRSVVARANFAGALAAAPGFDALALARRHGKAGTADDLASFAAELLLGRDPGPAWRRRALAAAGAADVPTREAAGRLVAAALASPEALLA